MIIFMTLAGIFCFAAFMCQVYALKSGKGAIVMAIINTQSFFQIMLEVFVEARIPTFYEIASIGFGILGAFIIAMAKK